MRKRKTPPSSPLSRSGFPVVFDQALKSGTEPGSVAKASSSWPGARSLMALAVFAIGIGQLRPLRSRLTAMVTLTWLFPPYGSRPWGTVCQ